MDEAYAQSLIEWMDGENGYRAWFAAHGSTATKSGTFHASDLSPPTSGDNGPPPPPPHK